jgi:hypothetical protein
VNRESFHDLVSHIENHPEFQSPPNSKKKQAEPEYQLLDLLEYLGTHGTAATNTSLASHFGIGEGTEDYTSGPASLLFH